MPVSVIRIFVVTALCVAALLSRPAVANAASPLKVAGSFYVDSRAFATASVALSSERLPGGFSFWGFTDFHGDHDSHDLDLTRSFSEYRLSHAGMGRVLNIDGLGLQAELNAISGAGNDLVRYGVTFRHGINLPWGDGASARGWLQWRVFPIESDNDGGQASVVFFVPISQRVQLKGFADYNVASRSPNRWVVEPELNFRMTDRITALIEVRYNGYENANPALRGTAVALGMRFQFVR